jgi:predicted kinase
MGAAARLVHLNGAPGVGKSSLARRFVDDHPLALLVDIDALRASLGRWSERDESRLVARELALDLAGAHLGRGHDVVVPQYVGRIEYVRALADTAHRVGADFVEVLLEVDLTVAVDRFRSRRHEFAGRGVVHPEADLDDADLEAAVAVAIDDLERVARRCPGLIRVPAGADLETTYVRVAAAVAEGSDGAARAGG